MHDHTDDCSIYECGYFAYRLSEEDKLAILEQFSEEFDINFEFLNLDGYQDIKFTNASNLIQRIYHIEGLWGCRPILSNIRYVCKEFLGDDFGFSSSKTGKLCQEIHNKYITTQVTEIESYYQ